MEKVFTSSRLADGNKISPSEIRFKNGCVVIKDVGINGKVITVPNSYIRVDSEKTPLVGFSSIKFWYMQANVLIKSTFSKKEEHKASGFIEVHGLSKKEVKDIKTLIEMGGLGSDDDDIDDDIDDDVDDNEFDAPKLSETSSTSTPEAQSQETPANKSGLEGLYDERLEKLINAALADGELTDKEKEILFRNAASQGIDLDEFEMVLEARLHERKAK